MGKKSTGLNGDRTSQAAPGRSKQASSSALGTGSQGWTAQNSLQVKREEQPPAQADGMRGRV